MSNRKVIRDTPFIIGSNLRVARMQKCLSQAALARQTGIGRPSIVMYEQGRHIPSVDKLITFSQTLEVSVDWLLGLR